MNSFSYLFDLFHKVLNYKLARRGLVKPANPITLTFSVTNMCQSKCKTCKIWELYLNKPELKEKELKLDEIEKIFKSMGHIYFFNISGGEPFLRKDLPDIVDLACKYLTPGVIHTPTNAISPKLVEEGTVEILERMKQNNRDIPFTIKPSFDGVGEKHDEIRGVKGNFERVLETLERLKKLQKKYSNLHVGIGTIISTYSIDTLKETADYAESLNVDSYINEIAEHRSELFNLNDPITPTPDEYEKAMEYFKEKTRHEIKTKRHLAGITQSFRLLYYDLVVKIMREKRQVLPCFASISNVHLSPYGDLWPCCILGYDKSMGNLREVEYDFKRIWYSSQAKEVREYIKKGNCYCPLANQLYNTILCNFCSVIKVIGNLINIRYLKN
ncbi:MAG: radical SAM protein [bacterium]